ncbi:TIMELESS-interacting protein isoform X1 [Nelusetta ayraudi]|uniref:TIMELESS-interacting protein isoform X1 n=1 Tax=Nelusetta ayraudi TaxID=303726 RepID=UPI003F721274
MSDPIENGLSDDEAFPPLPPPQSPNRWDQGDGEPFADDAEDGDVSKLAEVPAAKRKTVKRPQPKLDSSRLTSDRGLPALRTLFDNVRFKGKGHEAEDLRLLMQKMENWAHRLYPKVQFEEFIDRVERLGKKKEVQTCLKRIRLDMPLTHEDYTEGGEAAPEANVLGDPDPFSSSTSPDDASAPVHSTPAAPSLTEEQRQRMELNRQRALERKLARQQQQEEPSDSAVDSSMCVDEAADVLSRPDAPDEEMEGSESSSSISSTQQTAAVPLRDSEPTEPASSSSPARQPSSEDEDGDSSAGHTL